MDIMTSNVNIILILGGLLFILIAIVGGSFSIKEITIPKVPKWMRVISFFVGLALVYISIFPLQPPTPETGSISVSSTPSGASVYLDGSYKGTTPMTIKEVRADSYTITLKLTGYQDWSQTIRVIAGETAYVSSILTVQGISTPTQLSPADGSVFSNYPRTTTLKWSAVPGVASYTVEIDCYHCCEANQWCTDVGKTWKVVPNLATTSYTFDFVGAQPGRWRVWTVDANGQVSPKSSWWGFTYTR